MCLWVGWFQYQDDFLTNSKMVRMVHMNTSYGMDLEICDSKHEFWTKSDKTREVKKLKISLRFKVQVQTIVVFSLAAKSGAPAHLIRSVSLS